MSNYCSIPMMRFKKKIINQLHTQLCDKTCNSKNNQILHLLSVCVCVCVRVWQVQKEVHMQWLRWQERSYGVVSPAAKGSQMDTPF